MPATPNFLLRYLKSPGMIGAIAPSSLHLAHAMARQIAHPQALVEVGAGTGSITRSLVHQFPSVPLLIFEQDLVLAQHLHTQFPKAKTVADYLHHKEALLKALPENTTMVSSVPFRSIPKKVAQPTIDVILDFLKKSEKRKLVQFTYGLREPFDVAPLEFSWLRTSWVWRNAPPAFVWVLQQRASA